MITQRFGWISRADEDDEEQIRNRQQRVDDAHHYCVDDAAHQSRPRSPQRTEEGCYQRSTQTYFERALPSDHQLSELVLSYRRRTQEMTGPWRQIRLQELDRLIRVVKDRADKAEQHHQSKHRRGRHCELVLTDSVEQLEPEAAAITVF